ncbi:hypothetical protein ERJ75_000106300 [Trypanosoma vivax]|nr:hypothetical protein ERJ75_000106300 [Trypanosoma vivax]
MSRGNAPLFIVSLKPARSSAVQRTRAPLSPMAAGEAPAQMLPSGLRGAAAENPTRRTPPMMRREPHLVCNAMAPRGAALLCDSRGSRRVAVTKSRCCGRKNLSGTPATATLSLSTGALCQNTRGRHAQSSALCGDRGRGCRRDGKIYCKNGGLGAARRTWRARFGKSLAALRRDGVFDKTGRAGARGRGGGRTRFGPESSDAAGETRGPTRASMRHRAVPGHWAAVLNSSAKLTALMRRARRAWSNCLVRPQGPRAKAGCQCRFLMAAALWTHSDYQSGPPRRNNGDCRCSGQGATSQGPAALGRGVAQCASVAGAASVKPEPKLRIGEADAKEMDRVGVVREAAPITCGGLGGCPSPL